MPMQTLPTEVILNIFESSLLTSPCSFTALGATCKKLHGIFKRHEDGILKANAPVYLGGFYTPTIILTVPSLLNLEECKTVEEAVELVDEVLANFEPTSEDLKRAIEAHLAILFIARLSADTPRDLESVPSNSDHFGWASWDLMNAPEYEQHIVHFPESPQKWILVGYHFAMTGFSIGTSHMRGRGRSVSHQCRFVEHFVQKAIGIECPGNCQVMKSNLDGATPCECTVFDHLHTGDLLRIAVLDMKKMYGSPEEREKARREFSEYSKEDYTFEIYVTDEKLREEVLDECLKQQHLPLWVWRTLLEFNEVLSDDPECHDLQRINECISLEADRRRFYGSSAEMDFKETVGLLREWKRKTYAREDSLFRAWIQKAIQNEFDYLEDRISSGKKYW